MTVHYSGTSLSFSSAISFLTVLGMYPQGAVNSGSASWSAKQLPTAGKDWIKVAGTIPPLRALSGGDNYCPCSQMGVKKDSAPASPKELVTGESTPHTYVKMAVGLTVSSYGAAVMKSWSPN